MSLVNKNLVFFTQKQKVLTQTTTKNYMTNTKVIISTCHSPKTQNKPQNIPNQSKKGHIAKPIFVNKKV